jgi:non-ribosomal peptide synthetase component F
VSTGEPLSRELATAILERCALLWNVYGTAETAGCATLGLVAPDAPLTIGRPIAGARAYVVDRQGQPCPLGAVGELRLARNREPQRTGDRARWTADGQLALVGPAMAAAQPSV